MFREFDGLPDEQVRIGAAQPVLSTGVLAQFWHSCDENAKAWILESVQML